MYYFYVATTFSLWNEHTVPYIAQNLWWIAWDFFRKIKWTLHSVRIWVLHKHFSVWLSWKFWKIVLFATWLHGKNAKKFGESCRDSRHLFLFFQMINHLFVKSIQNTDFEYWNFRGESNYLLVGAIVCHRRHICRTIHNKKTYGYYKLILKYFLIGEFVHSLIWLNWFFIFLSPRSHLDKLSFSN